MTDVRPFPFEALESTTREAERLRRGVRAWIHEHAALEVLARELEALTNAPVSMSVGRVDAEGPAWMPKGSAGVIFGGARAGARAGLLLVEPALTRELLLRALGQRAPRVALPEGADRETVTGALAAVVHAALRRAFLDAPLQVLDAGPAEALVGDFRDAITVWLDVMVDGSVRIACVCLERPTVEFASARSASSRMRVLRNALAEMGEAELSVPLVAGACLLERTHLQNLHAGDVFVVPGLSLHHEAGCLRGEVSLVAPGAEHGVSAVLGEGDTLVIGSTKTRLVHEARNHNEMMTTEASPLTAVEEAPVVVRVELGSVVLSARAWSELEPGDVLPLGRRLGEPAQLRVAGVAIAQGELVQIDGEYGVRILAREKETG